MPTTITDATTHTIGHVAGQVITHSVAVTNEPRDWVALIFQALPSVASAGVAAYAIYLSSRQSQRSLQLIEEQNIVSRTKIKVDLFENRYDAWHSLMVEIDKYIDDVTNAMNIYPDQAPTLSDIRLVKFDNAAAHVRLVFGDDVVREVGFMKLALMHLWSKKEKLLRAELNGTKSKDMMLGYMAAGEDCREKQSNITTCARKYMPTTI